MKSLLCIFCIVASLLPIACGKSSSATQSSDDSSTQAADTIVIDTIATEPEPEPFTATSASEAIAYMDSSANAAEYAEGILHKMAEDNLDYTVRLLNNQFDHFIVVDKQSMHVVLYDRFGREQKSYRMACSKHYGAKHKYRDNRTPEGFFSAEGIYDSTDWLYTDDDGHTSQVKGQFGPRFIRLKTDVTRQIGIHGTCSPWALGTRASHGCIRIHNDNILELVEYVEPGMPIIVNPSDRDQVVNEEEGYTIASINIGKPRSRYSIPETPKPATDTIAPAPEEPQPADSTIHTINPPAIETEEAAEQQPLNVLDRRTSN